MYTQDGLKEGRDWYHRGSSSEPPMLADVDPTIQQ